MCTIYEMKCKQRRFLLQLSTFWNELWARLQLNLPRGLKPAVALRCRISACNCTALQQTFIAGPPWWPDVRWVTTSVGPLSVP